MYSLQQVFLIILGIGSLLLSVVSLNKCKSKHAFTETPFLFFLGIFVWGDALVFAPFWFFVSVLALLVKDWNLFLLIVSLFWLVRSHGETIYWFNQQFSTLNRNPPEKLFGYKLVKNDAVWYLYQIFWQCLTVFSLLASIYFGALWVRPLF